MVVHRGALFAATWNYDWTRVHSQDLQPCRVYRYDGPGKWEDCGQPGASRRLFSLASFRGDLYVVGADSTIHKYRGGTSWEKVHGFETFAHPMTIYDGRLILGMLHPATVWAFDGQDWQDLGNPLGDPERCNETHSLVTFHGALHVGTWPLGRVARWDPAAGRWRQVGRLGDSSEIMALNVYNGKLYGAAIPRAEVFRYEHNGSWTSLHRFFRPKGWRPVRVDNMRREPDGDRRMREWTRVTSLTQHDGLMFASIGSCTAAAADAAADIRGSVQAFSAGTTCTTLHSLTPGWHHIAARRSGGTIFLFVDGHAVAAKHGDLNRSIATDVSLRVGEDESGPYTSGIEAFQLVERALDDAEIRQLAQDIRPSLRATPTEEGLR
jgi:prepilin-type processing-associated H-X9-DG protein